MNYRIERDPTPAPKRIDYARMQKVFPQQKAALTRAVKSGDAAKVADACIKAVRVWDEIGAWPDDWSAWQRALNDLLPWQQQVDLTDVAYGRARIVKEEEE